MQLKLLFHKPVHIVATLLWLLLCCIALTRALPSPEPAPQPVFVRENNNNNNNVNANYPYHGNFESGPSIYAYTVDNQLNNIDEISQQQQQQQKQQQVASNFEQSRFNNNDNHNKNNNFIIDFATNDKYNGNNNYKSKDKYPSTAVPSGAGKYGPLAVTATQAAPHSGCNYDKLAVYKVVLHTYWTRNLFPKHYPDWRPTAQWTRTIGRVHDDSFTLFHIGQQASAGVKQFAETGKSELLELSDMEQQQQQQKLQKQSGIMTGGSERNVFDEFNIPAIVSGAGRSEAKFFVDSNHSLVSLMTRIVPSPDWFIGVDSFQLCVGGTWMDTVTVEMDPLDAGTDNGFTFTAPNWPTAPQGVIYRITSNYPAHPAGSFYYPKNKRLPPIATFQFIKLKEYELSEVFNFAEDERKYETVKTQIKLQSEQNHNELNNELSASIERERQNEVSGTQSTAELEKERVRAELLAKMNPTYNTSSTLMNGGTNNFMGNIVPKNDKNAIMQNIAHSYQSKNVGKRRRVKRPRDCRVSHWSEWSACSKACGIGEMHRYRRIIKHGKRGGRPCPALRESKWCGSEKGCHPTSSYFNWSYT